MSPPLLLLFTGSDQRTGALVDEGQAQALRAYLASVPPGSVWRDRFYVGAEQQTEHGALDAVKRGEPLILLAVGPEGGATLARWVDAHGLDGVAGVGLVGVTAPWAERGGCDDPAHKGAPCGRPLPSLEPLRAVAERARGGEPCSECGGSGDVRTPGTYAASLSAHEYGDSRCGSCLADGRAFPLRLVVACSPDDGVCAKCCGFWRDGGPQCSVCSGTGKALSSAEVMFELSGERRLYEGIDDFEATTGGLTTIHYPDRAALAEHGLRDVVERLTR